MQSVAGYMERRLPGPDVTAQQLRERSWWTGPELFVLVDDYDLVASGPTNPLTPLLEYLPQARDVGLHLVLTRRAGGAGRALYEPVIQRLRELSVAGPGDVRAVRRGRADRRGPARRCCRRGVAGCSPGVRACGWSSWHTCRRTREVAGIDRPTSAICIDRPHQSGRGFGVISRIDRPRRIGHAVHRATRHPRSA